MVKKENNPVLLLKNEGIFYEMSFLRTGIFKRKLGKLFFL